MGDNNIVNAISDAVSDIGGVLEDAGKAVVHAVEDIGKFAHNVTAGIVETNIDMVKGIAHGDWTEIRDAAIQGITTAAAILTIVVGVIFTVMGVPLGPYLIAAGLIVLDAQYNEGKLLGNVIATAGDIEEGLMGSTYINQYATEIQMLTTMCSMLAVSYVGGAQLANFTGLSSITAGWSAQLNVLQAGYGGYQTYMAIQVIRDSQRYWEEKLREAEAYYRKLIAQAQAARNIWFDMMTNPDMINRIQAGGDLFNLGAGHDLFSVTSVAEPQFALGLIDKSDPDMDKLMSNRYFGQSAGSDGFKIN